MRRYVFLALLLFVMAPSIAQAQWAEPYRCKTLDGVGNDITSHGGAMDLFLADIGVGVTFPLPTGAATEAKQDDAISYAATSDAFLSNIEGSVATTAADTTSIDGKLPALITEHTEDRVSVASTAHTCVHCSSSTPLGAGVTFPGAWQPIKSYNVIVVNVAADVDSAVDGVVIQHSPDNGATVTDVDTYTFYASETYEVWRPPPSSEYFKVSYTNGAAPQTSFSLSTTLRSGQGPNHAHRIGDSISDEDDGALTIAVIQGANITTDAYAAVRTVNSGSMMVSTEPRGVAIAEGLVPGETSVKKFGANDTVGAAWELVWEGSAVYDYLSAEEAFKIKSDSVEDDTDKGAAVAGTGAFTVQVSCVNQAWEETIQTVTMNGTALVTLSTADCMIAYRMEVKTAGTGGYNVGTLTLYQNDGATAQCHVTPGNNQSLIAHMPVFAGHTMRVNYMLLSEVSNKITEIGVFVRATPTGLFALKQFFTVSNNPISRPADVPNILPEKSIIAVRARSTATGANVAVNFDAIMKDLTP